MSSGWPTTSGESANANNKASSQFASSPAKTQHDAWLDQLLGGKSKQGVFEADFEDENGTTVTVRDGDDALLSCRVYLLHDKTVTIAITITLCDLRLRQIARWPKLSC